MRRPNVTVAAVAERDGQFLLVEERAEGRRVFNQPAGHLEARESVLAAVTRETLEETGYCFEPTALVGIYQWPHPSKDVTYLRFAFCGTITGHDSARPLDDGIIRAFWLSAHEIRSQQERLRSPLVLQCVNDYLAGHRHPLALITHLP
jgi:8-oxo-dGTP pyrophosphatase MutT (NUDIX family)